MTTRRAAPFGKRLRVVGAALVVACASTAHRAAETVAEPPRLAVLISIDQCRADYLVRFRPYFGAGGFRRLLTQGADFRECHQRHGFTATAPGHATIATGVHADRHGIVSNEWRDPETLVVANAVEDPASPLVGLPPAAQRSPGGVLESKSGRSPRRLLATTIGDQLKLRYPGRSRVVGLSSKDRQAILLGGRLADYACWIEGGTVVTSTYYRAELPAWAAAYNAEQHLVADFGKTWDRLLAPEIYDRVQGPDAAAGEESRLGLGTVFPRRVDGGLAAPGGLFFDAHRLTPLIGDRITELAIRAIDAEQLGRRDATDLLCLGFPQVDYAGHSFGPDSHEVMDLLLRLDRNVAALLRHLDETVGAGRYVVVLTADHGVSPLPERVQAFDRDVAAGRFDENGLARAIDAELDARFAPAGGNETWVVRDSWGYRLRPAALRRVARPRAEVAAVVRDVVARWPQMAAAWTREEIVAVPADERTLAGRVRLSFHPERSQDVVFVFRPYVVDRTPAGTNHGSPYEYDDHVPLVFFGAGVAPRLEPARVGVDQIVPTLAALLGVPPPPEAHAAPLF